MKITFSRTGGFANIPVKVELDSDNLPQDKADELKNLIQKLKPFVVQDNKASGADMHQYELDVEEDGEKHHLSTSDNSATEDMFSLFEFLMDQ